MRDKHRPKSGSIQARYVLVKDWMGGYNEVALRAGQLPISLPCIELDVTGFSGARVRGLKPEDVDSVVDSLLDVVKGPPDRTGLVGEITVELLEEHDVHITSDPDFWPRAFLDLAGQLKIRARDPGEAERLAASLITLAKKGVFRYHGGWATGEVSTGTLHHVSMIYDESSVFRIVAKIAYGVAFLHVGPEVMYHDPFGHLRRYIVGEGQHERDSPVRELSEPASIKDWPEHHLVMVEPSRGHLRGIVALYGGCHIVEFGPASVPLLQAQPVVAISRRDGTETQFLGGQIAGQVLQILRDHAHMYAP